MAKVELKFREAAIRYDGGYWLSIRLDRDTVGAARRFLYRKKDREYVAELKECRKKRSNDANAYCWALIGEISKSLGIPPNQVYREAIRDVGGNYTILPIQQKAVDEWKRIWSAKGEGWICEDFGRSKLPGYQNVICFYGSSVYDTCQMSRLIDIIVQECRELGIETKTPDELAAMVKEWGS